METAKYPDDVDNVYRDAFKAMDKITDACAGILSFQRVLETVLSQAINVLGLEGGSICMINADKTLGLVAESGLSQSTIDDLSTKQIQIGDCLCGNVARDKQTLILWNPEEVSKYASREAQRDERFKFHAAFPLTTRGTCHGVLCVFTKGLKKPLEKQLEALNMITRQAAMVIENTRLYEEKASSEREVWQAYADVFRAVTGDKLLILTTEELHNNLGDPVSGPYLASNGMELANGRAYIRATLEEEFPSLADKKMPIFAVGEAMANAIKHANGCSLQLFNKENTVQILVADKGPGIGFHTLPRATLLSGYSTKKSLGIGFDIMLEFCSRLLLSSGSDGTSIVLEFDLNG